MPTLPATTNLKKVYRQTFVLKYGSRTSYRHTLLINPEDMNINEPARNNVQQTLGGAYVSDFGSGLKVVTISGTTGYRARRNTDGQLKDGYTEMKDFRNKLYGAYVNSSRTDKKMYWYNWEDEEYYEIVPTNLRIMRNKNEPLLYRYELQFTCLRKLSRALDRKTKATPPSIEAIGTSMGTLLSRLSESRTRFR